MSRGNSTEDARGDQSASLRDLERLWGGAGQGIVADEALREHYLASGCPLPPPPPPPASESIWHQPPCA
ncbi:hypothetical protein K2Z83_21585 [Oscillochloris sp. ZM17-4]|uniref:hypothetical protein n=1 Tax=Oscillochloris sp. ZM17-4 TaxID=2866714 RepID=UPI001C73831D|nr:hypothetical protein [Oscillochloris sp. ZM17-4]MBX0330264.1 hypothetical protein [Oscillochloris sp. ZM17-4]